MRAVWPALWINKFTEHNAWVISAHEAGHPAHTDLVCKMDVVVFHKAHPANLRLAHYAKAAGCTIIYDTDDLDTDAFNEFHTAYYVSDIAESIEWFRSNSQGFVVASRPLLDHYDGVMIENGFDTTLPMFQAHPEDYFHGNHGRHYKIAWGGSSTHARDMAMFYRLGVIEEICNTLPVDFVLYGLEKGEFVKQFDKGKLICKPLHPQGIEWYIYEYYYDADILIAPLIQDTFNDHRSTLKLVEAGIAGKTIVASNTRGYQAYRRDGVSLVDNTFDQWTTALRELILNDALRDERSKFNMNAAYELYSAETLTQQRIEYFEECNAKV